MYASRRKLEHLKRSSNICAKHFKLTILLYVSEHLTTLTCIWNYFDVRLSSQLWIVKRLQLAKWQKGSKERKNSVTNNSSCQ